MQPWWSGETSLKKKSTEWLFSLHFFRERHIDVRNYYTLIFNTFLPVHVKNLDSPTLSSTLLSDIDTWSTAGREKHTVIHHSRVQPRYFCRAVHNTGFHSGFTGKHQCKCAQIHQNHQHHRVRTQFFHQVRLKTIPATLYLMHYVIMHCMCHEWV